MTTEERLQSIARTWNSANTPSTPLPLALAEQDIRFLLSEIDRLKNAAKAISADYGETLQDLMNARAEIDRLKAEIKRLQESSSGVPPDTSGGVMPLVNPPGVKP